MFSFEFAKHLLVAEEGAHGDRFNFFSKILFEISSSFLDFFRIKYFVHFLLVTNNIWIKNELLDSNLLFILLLFVLSTLWLWVFKLISNVPGIIVETFEDDCLFYGECDLCWWCWWLLCDDRERDLDRRSFFEDILFFRFYFF